MPGQAVQLGLQHKNVLQSRAQHSGHCSAYPRCCLLWAPACDRVPQVSSPRTNPSGSVRRFSVCLQSSMAASTNPAEKETVPMSHAPALPPAPGSRHPAVCLWMGLSWTCPVKETPCQWGPWGAVFCPTVSRVCPIPVWRVSAPHPLPWPHPTPLCSCAPVRGFVFQLKDVWLSAFLMMMKNAAVSIRV